MNAELKILLSRRCSLGSFLREVAPGTFVMFGLLKFLVNCEPMLPPLERLSEETVTGKYLETSYLTSDQLYGSVKEDVMPMDETADFFIKSPSRTSLFHAALFYKAAKLVLTYLREHYSRHSSIMHASFHSFEAVKLQMT